LRKIYKPQSGNNEVIRKTESSQKVHLLSFVHAGTFNHLLFVCTLAHPLPTEQPSAINHPNNCVFKIIFISE